MNNESVDSYLQDGCGRCDLYRTPECKVHLWTDALKALREILCDSALEETMKWGSPCYTYEGTNVLLLVSLRRYCGISFLRGAALRDERGLLEKPGPNSRYARYLPFTTLEGVVENEATIRAYVEEAIGLVRDGIRVEVEAGPEPMPDELADRLDADAELREAYERLTPGRQRSHILHVSGAKQAATRERRVEKCAPKILAGKGFNER